MVYGERLYNFTTVTEDSSSDGIIGKETAQLLEGFNAVLIMCETTGDYDLMEDYSEALAESFVLPVQEGANAEYTKIFKEHFKAMRVAAKKGKEYFKASKFKEAKAYYEKALKECDDLNKEFSKVNDTVLTTIIGFLLYELVTFIPLAISALAVTIPAGIIGGPLYLIGAIVAGASGSLVGGIAGGATALLGGSIITTAVAAWGIGAEITEICARLVELCSFIRNFDKQNPEKSLNLYKNKLQGGIKLMADGYKKKIAQCDELAKTKSATAKVKEKVK